MEEERDPLGVFKEDCHISSSQEYTLTHSRFAREDDFPSPLLSGNEWPEFSSSSSSSSSSDVVTITICSAPETPEPRQQDDDASTPLPEEFKTPPEVAAPTSASSEDAVSVGVNAGDGGTSPVADCCSPDLGFSGEEERPNRKRERDESCDISPSAKKSKASEDLGFPESTEEFQATVVLVRDDNEAEVEEEREILGKTPNGGDTEVVNNVDERKEDTENEKLEVRTEMSDEGELKLKLNLEANTNSEKDGLYLMKCVLEVLKNLAGGNQEGENNEPIDILETAKLRGMTFPRSRWYDLD